MNKETSTNNIILMPRGMALWLKENSKLTIDQIANFCQLDYFTVNSINEENTVAFNPVETGQTTLENIKKCEIDSKIPLRNILNLTPFVKKNTRKVMTEMQKKQKPRFISWILKQYPNVNRRKLAKIMMCREFTIQKLEESLKNNTLDFFLNPIKQGILTEQELIDICN